MENVKKYASALLAALFVFAALVGVPVEQMFNTNTDTQKATPKKPGTQRFGLSDECAEEVITLQTFGSVSDECEKEVSKLRRLMERVENICRVNREKGVKEEE